MPAFAGLARVRQELGNLAQRAKRRPRDDRGWIIPKDGTLSRQIYDLLVQGKGTAEIASRLGVKVTNTRVLAYKIRIAMKTIIPVFSVFVLAFALMSASAAPMHHNRHTKAATGAPPQIACTVVGCMPVPRGCHPEMGYTPDGTPTGFDVAVCPNYTLYGNHR